VRPRPPPRPAEKKAAESGGKLLLGLVDALFVMALAWTVGATAAGDEGRAAFSAFARAAMTNGLADYVSPKGAYRTMP
jgi:hypothetical protein